MNYIRLRDLKCSLLSGYGLKSEDFATEGIPIIKIGNIQDKRVYPNKSIDYYREQLITDKLKDYLLKDGDVLIAMTGQGSVGRVGKLILSKSENALLNQRVGKFICDEINLNKEYLFYILTTDLYQDYLFSAGTGSGQPNLSPEVILETEIPALEYNEQKTIAAILNSLDDKIDLLHRQNKTLEAITETFFRQWFVEEADESWQTVRIGDFVKTNISCINKNTSLKTIKYLDTSSITEGEIENYQIFEIKDAPSRARRIVRHNDILISTVRPNQKHYGIVMHPSEEIIVSTGFCVITCETISPYFVYKLLTSDEMTEYLHSIAEGSTSTYPSFKPSDIENLEFNLPPIDKLNFFSEFNDNIWNEIANNYKQINTLKKLRDTLLPKLMSGEVRVNN